MTARLMRGVALLLVGLFLALPAMAADSHGEGAAEVAEHASPPLFSVDPGLMIWTIVTFVIVLIVLTRTAWKPLQESLREREQAISGSIEEARKIKAEAEALLAKYETVLGQAKDESKAILDEARKDATVVQEEIRAKAAQEADEFKARAHREIELAKDGALQEIWDEAASISTELASRILGRSLQDDDQQRLVRELINDMRSEMGSGKQKAENV